LHSMVLRLVLSYGGDISGHLTIFKLSYMRTTTEVRGNKLRTWRTVTGKRAPCSSHIAVIPRFRAMTPVRMQVGVHFATVGVEDCVSAYVTALQWIVLRAQRGERGLDAQMRNMRRANSVFGSAARDGHKSDLEVCLV
jgi:hypothetical protein